MFLTQKPRVVINHYPLWKNLLIFLVVVLSFIYTLPTLYGETAAVQVSIKGGKDIEFEPLEQTIRAVLDKENLTIQTSQVQDYHLELTFKNTPEQIHARDLIKTTLGEDYTVALALAPNMPAWLSWFGGSPIKRGLDLRGGMYFLLEIDTQTVIENLQANTLAELKKSFREENIRYTGIKLNKEGEIVAQFKSGEATQQAVVWVRKHHPSLIVMSDELSLTAAITEEDREQAKIFAADQTVQVMRNRVNELGVAEASVAKQGTDRVVIELPGVQDAAQAQEVIGGTATLKVVLVDEQADVGAAVAGRVPAGSSLYKDEDGRPYVLKNQVVLSGNAVTGANAGFSQDSGLPAVFVTLTGPEVNTFSKVTGQNIGHLMAIVLVQKTFTKQEVDGEMQRILKTKEEIISVAKINDRLGSSFQITGTRSPHESQHLAMMIRAGALPAPVSIVEERQIGPSLGEKNIEMGQISVLVAMAVVVVFMAAYYGVFGILANIALVLNLFFIIAAMSLLPGATLTLPGIAGVVLNVGMSIDANVLIFERIREEIRNKVSYQLAIKTGYDKAFATIIDSHVTTLIVALILFGIGAGPVKGFAVTLIIGILTSIFTSITVTRALSNFIYGGGRKLKNISIGI